MPSVWVLGTYRLDPAAFTLERDGEAVALQRRPLDLLLYLIGRPGQVVSHDELKRVVWGGVNVSAGALSTAVYEARTALADLDRAPSDRWIETVRGRGFRYRGPATRVADATEGPATPPFIGREPLCADLCGDVRRLQSGRGGVRVVEGLAGMGKTRLVQEVTRSPGTAAVLTVYCERGGPPHWPWMQLLRELGRRNGGSPSGEPSWLIDAPAGDLASEFRFERLDRMLQTLTRATELVPLVLVFEDLQWSDVPSLELLESVGRHLGSLPVLILATHRVGEEAGDPVRAWTRSPHIRCDRLDPLSAGELYLLAGALIGKLPSPEFVGWIHKHSGGVPLMVRELADSFDGDETALPDVPQLAHLLLARRFEGLSREARRAIAVAALCGERFDVPLVEAAAGREAGDDRGWLREGMAGGILVADPRQPLRYAFRHTLLRDAARGGLTPGEAAEWHGRLARVLEQLHPDPDGAAVSQLARHSGAAALLEGDLTRPLRYALLAARHASEVFAWEDVRVHTEHALAWLPFTAPGPARESREVEAALLRCAGITPYSGHVEESEALLRRIGPALARTEDPRPRALAEGFRFANARSLGDFTSALGCADRVADLPGMAPVAECWRLGVASLAGRLTAATALPDWEDALGDDPAFIAYARLCGRDPEVDRLGLTAFASWGLGRDTDALERAGRAVRWADDRGDARSRIWALFMLCMLHDLRRDWAALAELAPVVDEQTTRHGITPWLGVGTALSIWARARAEGAPMPSGSQFASILRERGHASNVSLRTMLLLLSSRIFSSGGDLAGAEEAARDGLACCARTEERHVAPELERQLARVLACRGDAPGARQARERALERAREQGHVVAEIRARSDRIAAGERVAADRPRLRALRKRVGARIGPHERALLDRLAVSSARAGPEATPP